MKIQSYPIYQEIFLNLLQNEYIYLGSPAQELEVKFKNPTTNESIEKIETGFFYFCRVRELLPFIEDINEVKDNKTTFYNCRLHFLRHKTSSFNVNDKNIITDYDKIDFLEPVNVANCRITHNTTTKELEFSFDNGSEFKTIFTLGLKDDWTSEIYTFSINYPDFLNLITKEEIENILMNECEFYKIRLMLEHPEYGEVEVYHSSDIMSSERELFLSKQYYENVLKFFIQESSNNTSSTIYNFSTSLEELKLLQITLRDEDGAPFVEYQSFSPKEFTLEKINNSVINLLYTSLPEFKLRIDTNQIYYIPSFEYIDIYKTESKEDPTDEYIKEIYAHQDFGNFYPLININEPNKDSTYLVTPITHIEKYIDQQYNKPNYRVILPIKTLAILEGQTSVSLNSFDKNQNTKIYNNKKIDLIKKCRVERYYKEIGNDQNDQYNINYSIYHLIEGEVEVDLDKKIQYKDFDKGNPVNVSINFEIEDDILGEIPKDPYEISVWEDYPSTINNNGQEKSIYKERKVCVIGSSSMSSQARALEPALHQSINGTKTLTFSMYRKYVDNYTGKEVENPYIGKLINERKVKLYWDYGQEGEKWFDFIIKNIQENSEDQTVQYTCEDLFITELGKNGYELNFSEDAQNNQGTLKELTYEVLEGSDWSFDDDNSDIVLQTREDALYKAQLNPELNEETLTKIISVENESVNLKDLFNRNELTCYVPYTLYATHRSDDTSLSDTPIQFIYVEDGKYTTDGTNNVINNAQSSWYIEDAKWQVDLTTLDIYLSKDGHRILTVIQPDQSAAASLTIETQYRGNVYIRKQLTTYDPIVGKYVYVYNKKSGENSFVKDSTGKNNQLYYGFYDFDFKSNNLVTNLITNYAQYPKAINWLQTSSTFVKDVGKWIFSEATSSIFPALTKSTLSNLSNSASSSTTAVDVMLTSTLNKDKKVAQMTSIVNTDIQNLTAQYSDGLVQGQKFNVELKIDELSGANSEGTFKDIITLSKIGQFFVDICKRDSVTGKIGESLLGFLESFGKNEKKEEGIKLTLKNIETNAAKAGLWLTGIIELPMTLTSEMLSEAVLVIKAIPKNGVVGTIKYSFKLLESHFYEVIDTVLGKNITDDKAAELLDADASSIQKRWNYYLPELQKRVNNKLVFIPLYKSILPWVAMSPVYSGSVQSEGMSFSVDYRQFEKIRTLNAEKSNRFNLLQKIAELFQVWCRFEIEHEVDGSIKRYTVKDISDHPELAPYLGKYKKKIIFKKAVGKELSYGFVYGIDLQSIQRSSSSSDLVTKVIVAPNFNEYAEDGVCDISFSSENYAQDNFILNFDYYINQGLLDRDEIYKDLYDQSNGHLGYYTKLRDYNKRYTNAVNAEIALSNYQTKLEAKVTVYEGLLQAAIKEQADLYTQMVALAGGAAISAGTTLLTQASSAALSTVRSLVGGGVSAVRSALVSTVTSKLGGFSALGLIGTVMSNLASTGFTTASLVGSMAANTIKQMVPLIAAQIKTYNDTGIYGSALVALLSAKLVVDETLEANQANQKELIKSIKKLNATFYEKYSPYIHEGTWQSDQYIDPTLYYIDALGVAATSSKPTVQYDISVIRVSELEEFKQRRFEVGDITTIEDVDFFGYVNDDGIKTPYREEVVISESMTYLEEPDRDTFTIQNYRTQFEDLFQRISASIQSLQYSQGAYARAASIVNGNGEIKEEVLKASIANAQDIVNSANDESVVTDNTGVTVTDQKNTSQKTKLTSGGLVFTKDGGNTWSTLLNADGVSTSLLSSGMLSTSKIVIQDNDQPTFKWDKTGINAYSSNDSGLSSIEGLDLSQFGNGINYNKFTRFDRFGLYGYDGTQVTNADSVFEPQSIKEVQDNTLFSLTWDGLQFNGKKSESNSLVKRAYFGKIPIDEKATIFDPDKSTYGLQINNNNGKYIFRVASDGILHLRGELTTSSSNDKEYIQLTTNQNGDRAYSVINFKNNDLDWAYINSIYEPKSSIFGDKKTAYTMTIGVRSVQNQASFFNKDNNAFIAISAEGDEKNSWLTKNTKIIISADEIEFNATKRINFNIEPNLFNQNVLDALVNIVTRAQKMEINSRGVLVKDKNILGL